MKNLFLLEIITPERVIFSQEVLEAVVPTASGNITILANHAPLISVIIPGRITIKMSNDTDVYIAYKGFLQIIDNVSTLLMDSVTHIEALDYTSLDVKIKLAKEELENAETMHERNKHEDFFHQLSSLRHSL